MDEMKRIEICPQCQQPEYWGEMRWLGDFCICRNCYKSIWERENHKQYTWDDLDGKRPSQEMFDMQELAEKFDAQSLELQLATNVPSGTVDCFLVNGGNDDYLCKQFNGGCKFQADCAKLIRYQKPIIDIGGTNEKVD